METTPEQKAEELITKCWGHTISFRSAKDLAEIMAFEVRAAVPMYTAALNPQWQYWNDVITAIKEFKNI